MAIWAGSTRELTINLATVPLFIAAIIAHELAHAQTAKAFGIPVRHIALTWFGGFAEFWMTPHSRWREATIAFAGPAANLVLAAFAFAILEALFTPQPAMLREQGGISYLWYDPQYRAPAVQAVLQKFAYFNLGVGLFNLLPGLPFDGGHILRALLSARISRGRASWIAAWAGVVFGVATIAIAFVIESLWMVAIGVFVVMSAWAEKRRLRYD